MKKIISVVTVLLILVSFGAANLFAANKWPSEKWPAGAEKWPELSDKWPSEKWPADAEKWPSVADQQFKEDPISQAIAAKAVLSFFEVGNYLFTLQEGRMDVSSGYEVYTYWYRPQNGPAVFEETVEIDPRTGETEIVSASVLNRLVGPLHVQTAKYAISEIEVTIYSKKSLRSMAVAWRNYFGPECVSYYKKSIVGPFDMLEVRHTPKTAFLTRDGRVVEVTAYAVSDEFGPYRRTCSAKAPGVLFKKFNKGVEQFKRSLEK